VRFTNPKSNRACLCCPRSLIPLFALSEGSSTSFSPLWASLVRSRAVILAFQTGAKRLQSSSGRPLSGTRRESVFWAFFGAVSLKCLQCQLATRSWLPWPSSSTLMHHLLQYMMLCPFAEYSGALIIAIAGQPLNAVLVVIASSMDLIQHTGASLDMH